MKQENNVFTCVIERGLSAVPRLVELIDVNEKCQVGFYETTSSSFDEFSQDNYKGIKAAYLIETLIRDPQMNRDDHQPMKLFPYGVIVRENEAEAEWRPLNETDMKSIKQIYSLWWLKNKNRTLQDIRKENYNILNGSRYKWI